MPMVSACRSTGQVAEVFWMATDTSGGCSDTPTVKEETAMPAGPESVEAANAATPEGNWPKALRNDSAETSCDS